MQFPDRVSHFQEPVPGEQVIVSDMRRRKELNGAHGEILDSTVDEFGRVTVRLHASAGSS